MKKEINGLDHVDVFYSKTKAEAIDKLNEYLENGAINAGKVLPDEFSDKCCWVLWVR